MIGIDAFLALADALQQAGEKPRAPLIHEVLPSGRATRPVPERSTVLLTRELCDECGLQPYIGAVQARFVQLLQLLDLQVCLPD